MTVTAEDRRIVWILGAGFSKPLGAPLLDDLFLPATWDLYAIQYGESRFSKLRSKTAEAVHWLYNHGRRFTLGRSISWNWTFDGEALWANAEEFLDYLDTAATAPTAAALKARIEQLAGKFLTLQHPGVSISIPAVDELAAAARRLLAAECSAFLSRIDLKSERCDPFVRWAQRVGPKDTVITFNYDIFLDLLAMLPNCKFAVVDPATPELEPDLAPALKLHGSVDWGFSNGVFKRTDNKEFSLICNDSAIGIASPGPKKLEATGSLKDLWDKAVQALQSADAVVFLGYRFPPTDSHARHTLLTALAENGKPYLALHTVLGPDIGSPASARLRELLRYAMRLKGRIHVPPRDYTHQEFSLVQHPLYTEDFLSLFERHWVTDREHVMSVAAR